jgi:hypothetical protein
VLFVLDQQLIPEGLAVVAPGPELARMLAGIDLSALRVMQNTSYSY